MKKIIFLLFFAILLMSCHEERYRLYKVYTTDGKFLDETCINPLHKNNFANQGFYYKRTEQHCKE